MQIEAIIGARRSLQRNLVVNVVLALLVCITLAMAILVNEFFNQMDDNARDALLREASEVAAELDPAHPALGQNPAELRFTGDAGAYRYTIFGPDWQPLVGNELADQITPVLAARLAAAAQTGEMIDLGRDRIGVILRRDLPQGEAYILASTLSARAGQSGLQVLRHEIEEQLGWIFFGAITIIAAAILAARRSLRPLKLALSQAQGIAPGAPERRLASEPLPTELRPLITAVNSAFDRLEQGYQAQRDFSSNVAHEVRTPLAVLRSGIETVEYPLIRGELLEDLGRHDRMFEQLIDLARADALGLTGRNDVDLHDIAVDLATEMSGQALRAGRTLAVTGAAHAAARSHAGLLGVALGNLLRNALIQTPEGSEVEIEVLADPPGWRVLDRGPGVDAAMKPLLFERFQRGAARSKAQSDTSGGAGIGLAIVKTVAEAHGGRALIEDRPGGGAIFTVLLPARQG